MITIKEWGDQPRLAIYVNMTKILPRGKNILVKPDPEKSRISEHGITMPTNVEQDKKAIGTVMAVGPEIKDVKKGDKVIYGVYSGELIKIEEKGKEVDYVLLLDEWVLAFLK